MLDQLRAEQRWLLLPEAIEVVRQIAIALEYAHQRHILHRDIKPANIMLKRASSDTLSYQPIITDLGLAKLGEGTGITQTGISMGTPAYMSPEQALGEPTDARSDVYSLGVLLYELALGQRPFATPTWSAAVRAHTRAEPPPPKTLRPDLSTDLERIILKTLAKHPNARFASSQALAPLSVLSRPPRGRGRDPL
jgi:eukaryotic-like serine/threonine-protein kinase